MDGGIFGLLGLIAQHRGAVEYDWRTRFRCGLSVIGDGMSLPEAARLALILRSDPSSMIAAAMEGWEYPVSRAEIIALDTYDLTLQLNWDRKKNGPAPLHHLRPGKPQDDRQRTRRGDTKGRTTAEVIAILRHHGHGVPV